MVDGWGPGVLSTMYVGHRLLPYVPSVIITIGLPEALTDGCTQPISEDSAAHMAIGAPSQNSTIPYHGLCYRRRNRMRRTIERTGGGIGP